MGGAASGIQTPDLRITSRRRDVHRRTRLACRCPPTCAPVRECPVPRLLDWLLGLSAWEDNGRHTDRPSRASSACRWCPFVTAAHPPVGPVWGPERTGHYESQARRVDQSSHAYARPLASAAVDLSLGRWLPTWLPPTHPAWKTCKRERARGAVDLDGRASSGITRPRWGAISGHRFCRHSK